MDIDQKEKHIKYTTRPLYISTILVLFGVIFSTVFNLTHSKHLLFDIDALKARQIEILYTVKDNQGIASEATDQLYEMCNRIRYLEQLTNKEPVECKLTLLIPSAGIPDNETITNTK